MDLNRVDLIIKFSLACAGQNDLGERELGPIHLIKYVYLADLYFAEHHQGSTFTGIPWQFYHFGPWSPDVFHRIEPIIQEVGATERRYESTKFENDAVRYTLEDSELLKSLERQLPLDISGRLEQAIKKFGSDTSSLLHHVYTTPPMLEAAPGEVLNFKTIAAVEEDSSAESEAGPSLSRLDHKKLEKKKAKAGRQVQKEAFRELLTRKAQKKRVSPPTPPPYDEVFFSGLEWLDSLAGTPIEEGQGELTVSADVWKSRARREQEL